MKPSAVSFNVTTSCEMMTGIIARTACGSWISDSTFDFVMPIA